MIKQQHKLLKYHMLPVQVPGRSSNRRCRSRVTSDRAFGPARPDVRHTSNSDQILQSSEMSRRANKRHRAESFDQSSAPPACVDTSSASVLRPSSNKRNEDSAFNIVIRSMRALPIMAIVSIIALPIVRTFIELLVPKLVNRLARFS